MIPTFSQIIRGKRYRVGRVSRNLRSYLRSEFPEDNRMLLPENNEEVLRELDRVTAPRGTIRKLSDKIEMEESHIRQVKCGARTMNQKLAAALGYKLMWIKGTLNDCN